MLEGDGAGTDDVAADGAEREAGGGGVAYHAAPDERGGRDAGHDGGPGEAKQDEQPGLKGEQKGEARPTDGGSCGPDCADVEPGDQEHGESDAGQGQDDGEGLHDGGPTPRGRVEAIDGV